MRCLFTVTLDRHPIIHGGVAYLRPQCEYGVRMAAALRLHEHFTQTARRRRRRGKGKRKKEKVLSTPVWR